MELFNEIILKYQSAVGILYKASEIMDVTAFFHYVTFSEKQEINYALGNFTEDTSHGILFHTTIEIVAWKKTRCIEGCRVFF